MSAADTLRAAATILRQRSTKPDSLWMKVFTKILTDQADKIDAEQLRGKVETIAKGHSLSCPRCGYDGATYIGFTRGDGSSGSMARCHRCSADYNVEMRTR